MLASLSVFISTAALDIAGLDDVGRFTDIARRRASDRLTQCTGTIDALRSLATELHDRATEQDGGGYGHATRERRTCRLAVESLRKHYGITPR